LRRGITVSLEEVFTFDVFRYSPKYRFNFSFHRLLYDPDMIKTSGLALERGAIRKQQCSFFRDVEDSVSTSLFSWCFKLLLCNSPIK
jgi:hypothetical protein